MFLVDFGELGSCYLTSFSFFDVGFSEVIEMLQIHVLVLSGVGSWFLSFCSFFFFFLIWVSS